MTARGKGEVALELAACMIAMAQRVAATLAAEPPRLADVARQAQAAFRLHQADWWALVEPVMAEMVALARDRVVGPELVRQATRELGEHVESGATVGFAEAMDLQLARSIHPDVAWVRAVAAYGLPQPWMRAYINAAIATGPDGAMPTFAADKVAAQKALIASADHLATTETDAWSTLPALPDPVAKAFDPHERRDADGKWTRTEVAERPDDGVDELLAPVKEGKVDRYASATTDRYASAADRYASATGDRYASVDRYASATEDRYASAPEAKKDRYAATDRYATAQRRVRNQTLFLLGNRKPGDAPAEPVQPGSGEWGMYYPQQDLVEYYADRDKSANYDIGRNLKDHSLVDFDEIMEHYEVVRKDPHMRVELQEHRSPWDVVEPLEVDQHAWEGVLHHAVPLWEKIQQDPMAATEALGTSELSAIAERCGFAPTMNREALLEQFQHNTTMRDNQVKVMRTRDGVDVHYDPALFNALADYIVWHEPEAVDDQEMVNLLEHNIGRDMLDNSSIPSVLSFSSGVHDDEDIADMRGLYRVRTTEYHSAIHDYGYGVPAGMTEMQVSHLVPKKRGRV